MESYSKLKIWGGNLTRSLVVICLGDKIVVTLKNVRTVTVQ